MTVHAMNVLAYARRLHLHPLEQLSGRALLDAIGASRFDPQSTSGFYESYFVRANHPSEPQAFWIRYTLFCPRGRSVLAVGQLWAIYFDGQSAEHIAIKQSVPFESCSFSARTLDVRIGDCTLSQRDLSGSAVSGNRQIAWSLAYRGAGPPVFLLPLALYSKGFPKAKALTGIPLADFDGTLHVNGKSVPIHGWRGSQNHNWGVRHTDRYAWGQVAGFEGHPDAFLECSTAKLRIGPLWTPWLTNLVLRVPGREIRLNSLTQALRNRARYRCFEWNIVAQRGCMKVEIDFAADADRVVRLMYDDPPGGDRVCLNTKLAACSVRVTEAGRPLVELHTSNRAAFEILPTSEVGPRELQGFNAPVEQVAPANAGHHR
jgi:hypothetical protein